MPQGPLNPRDLGRFVAIGQVGMEMVAPVGIGLALDHYLGWTPWATVAGACLGLVVGITHLVVLANRSDEGNANRSNRDPPS
jgi:F0F1-type ATP synthase assembly protein I